MRSGSEVVWTSAKRERRAEVITSMQCAPPQCHLVRVTQGLPGEKGRCFVVPTWRLRALREPSR